jgi:hypothetical protein
VSDERRAKRVAKARCHDVTMSRGRGREKAREYGGTRVRGHECTARGRLYHRAKRVLTMPVRGVSIGPVLSCVAAAPLRSYPQCSPPLFAPLLLFALFARLCSSLLLAAVRATSRHIAAPLRSSSPFAPRGCAPLRHSHRVAALLFALRTAWLRRHCAPRRSPLYSAKNPSFRTVCWRISNVFLNWPLGAVWARYGVSVVCV